MAWHQQGTQAVSCACPCRYSGKVGLGLLFPIVNDNIVWTLGSPLGTVSDAGVKFVPRNVPQKKLDELQQHFQDDADNEWSTGKSKKDVSCAPCFGIELWA